MTYQNQGSYNGEKWASDYQDLTLKLALGDKLVDFFSLECWKKGQRGLLKTKTENQGSQHSENGPCNYQDLSLVTCM